MALVAALLGGCELAVLVFGEDGAPGVVFEFHVVVLAGGGWGDGGD